MKIESIDISKLNGDPANTRQHDPRNLEAIQGSLARFGQQKPIVVDSNGVVIAGNGTLQAAKSLGWKKLDVVRTDLVGPEATAYAIADNRTAELAAWNDDALAETLAALQGDEGIDETSTGFTEAEIEKLIQGLSGDQITEDEAPEPPADPVTQPGDLILLGDHRLLCGDSTNADDVKRLMPHEVPLCLTDPPYNVGREYDASTDDSKADYCEWSVQWFTIARSKCDRVAFSCGHPNVVMWASIEAWHWMLCWYKGNAMLGSPFGFCNWEPVLFYGKPHRPKGHDVIVQPIVVQKDLEAHDCPKQLGFGVKLLDLLSEEGDEVYDPFLGSGTTLIAAEQLNRRCYGIEISPAYCDVIVQRWENLTGDQAERISAPQAVPKGPNPG